MSGGRAWAEAEDRISCNTHLDARRLVQAVLLHVDDLARVAVDACGDLTVCVLCAERGQRPYGAASAVLDQRARDHLHGVCDSLDGSHFHAIDAARKVGQPHAHRHLRRSTAGRQGRVEDDVARDGHGVGEVALDLVQDVFGGPAEEDRAGFRGLAFGEVGEVSVINKV